MQTFSYVVISHAVVCAIGLVIGFFGMMMSFGHSIQTKFSALNEHFKVTKNHRNLQIELRDAINFHINVKELSIAV